MSIAAQDISLSLINGVPGYRVSVFDRALNYGDGLFETIRIVDSQPVLAPLHWQRLDAGLERLQIPLASGAVALQQQQLLDMAAAAGHRDGIIKIIVSRGEGGRGFAPLPAAKPNIWVRWYSLPDYPPSLYQQGVELQLCHTRLPHRPGLAGLKHLNCLDYVLAFGELAAGSGRQGLLLDESGHLVEVTSANLFLVQDGCLRTPLLHRCGVAGTMRRWIMETLAPRLKLTVEEQDLPLQALKGAEEIFICNSVFGVMPVRRMADCRWPRGTVTRAVQEQVMKLFDA